MNRIDDKGFKIKVKKTGGLSEACIIALRKAIKAYFNTYHILRHNDIISLIKEKNELKSKSKQNEEKKVNMYIDKYGDLYNECYLDIIIYFCQFVEILMKEFLELQHELLIFKVNVDKFKEINISPVKHQDVYDAIESEKVDKTYFKQETLNFAETLDRVIKLDIEDSRYSKLKAIIKKYKGDINELSKLRNRAIHKGVFYLHLDELDKLVGRRILRLVDEIFDNEVGVWSAEPVSLNKYRIYTSEYHPRAGRWIYPKLSIDIDPIKEILRLFDTPQDIDYIYLQLIKEMGRAAYNNPMQHSGIGRRALVGALGEKVQFSKVKASHMLKYQYGQKEEYLKVCPVCGTKSIVPHYIEDYENESEEIDYIVCTLCDFTINRASISDVLNYNLPNYFDK